MNHAGASEPGALGTRDSQRRLARTTGLLYLVILVFAMFAPMVRETLVVPGDPAATAGNVLGSLWLFRLSLVAWLVIVVADVAISATLYFLLEPAGRVLSGVAAGLRLAYTVMLAALLPRLFDAYLLLTDPGLGARFEPAEVWTLALAGLEGFGAGFVLALVVFGAHLVALGALLHRSRYVPGWLALLLVAAGAGYVLDGLGTFFVPAHGDLATGILLTPAVLGEFALTGWLLVKGVDASRPRAEAAARAAF